MNANPHQTPFQPIRPPEGRQAPQPPKQRSWFARHKILTVLLGAVVVIGIASAVGGGGGEGGDGAGGSGTTDAAKTARIGSPVRDGKFEFLVSGVDCGRDRLGEAYLNTTAQGQFCLVSMRITNIGDEPQTMFSDNQKLFDAAGREYAADTEAAFYLDEASQTLWEEINPGNTVKGVVVFDVPKKTTPTRLRLHDSAFSGGVVIEL